jgi:hypothetical protein
MVYINVITAQYDSSRTSLTAPLALSLAEHAYKSGRIEAAFRYVEMAYAIFDAQASMAEAQANALPRGG